MDPGLRRDDPLRVCATTLSEEASCPCKNRVSPFGEIVATAHRGRFTGNRGIIHDPATRTLLNRRWSSKAWITCVCEFCGRRRKVMGGRSWTELFFLDEATSFAAGHRPCFYCRRAEAEAFRNAWANGNGRAKLTRTRWTPYSTASASMVATSGFMSCGHRFEVAGWGDGHVGRRKLSDRQRRSVGSGRSRGIAAHP